MQPHFDFIRYARSLFSIVATVLFFFQLNAQIQSHAHKAKISFSEKSFADLAKLGIALDHGIHKTGEYFIGDFSHEELEKYNLQDLLWKWW